MSKRRTVDQQTVRAAALALPVAVEGAHMGHPDFRVRNKIFATLHPDGHTANFKATPDDVDACVRDDPRTYQAVWGGRYLGVDLRHVDEDALVAIVEESWSLVAPRGLVAMYRKKRPRS